MFPAYKNALVRPKHLDADLHIIVNKIPVDERDTHEDIVKMNFIVFSSKQVILSPLIHLQDIADIGLSL